MYYVRRRAEALTPGRVLFGAKNSKVEGGTTTRKESSSSKSPSIFHVPRLYHSTIPTVEYSIQHSVPE